MRDEKDTIAEFYQKIEQVSEIKMIDINIIPNLDEASKYLRFIVCVEVNANLSLNKEHIDKVFMQEKEKTISYLERRIEKTSNDLLKSRYNHFLYVLTQNNKYCGEAIEYYKIILDQYLQNLEKIDNRISFQKIFDLILSLSKTSKYKINELKEQIHKYLKDENIIFRIKTHIIQKIEESELFKISELSYIPELCIKISRSEIDPHWIKTILNVGLNYALKYPKDKKQLCFEINELLGDNEYRNIKHYDGKPENMVIPHYNQDTYKKMINHYHKAKNKNKLDEAKRLYSDNKKNLKLIKMISRIENQDDDKLNEDLNNQIETLLKAESAMIIFYLCLGNNFILIDNDKLNEYAEEQSNSIISEYCDYYNIDINSNSRKDDKFSHNKFELYALSVKCHLDFMIRIILRSIESKKLSYTKMSNMLKINTFFGSELICNNRITGEEISYTFFQEIDFALKSFFQQCKLYLKKKQPDWRITIDILSLKFEGILRDIINITSQGNTTIFKREDHYTEMLLDDLLRCDTFIKIFNEDDKNLFLYTFTNKGRNIRNNVAHSFYKPQDYNIYNAVLVLLCLLRLTKFSNNNITNS